MFGKNTPNLETLQKELKKVWCQEMSTKSFRNLSGYAQTLTNGHQKLGHCDSIFKKSNYHILLQKQQNKQTLHFSPKK